MGALLVARDLRVVSGIGARGEEIVDQIVVAERGAADECRGESVRLDVLAISVRRLPAELRRVPVACMAHSEGRRVIEGIAGTARAVGGIVRVEKIGVGAAVARGERPRAGFARVFQAERRRDVEALVILQAGCVLALRVAVGIIPAEGQAGPEAQRAEVQSLAQFGGEIPHRTDPLTGLRQRDGASLVDLRSGPAGSESGIAHCDDRREDILLRQSLRNRAGIDHRKQSGRAKASHGRRKVHRRRVLLPYFRLVGEAGGSLPCGGPVLLR